VPKRPKHLIIGSTEDYSGKSTVLLGLGRQFANRQIPIAYGKPLGTLPSETDGMDEDVRLAAEVLNLPSERVGPTLAFLNETAILRRLSGEDGTDYGAALGDYAPGGGDLVLVEGAGSLDEGRLFGLAVPEVAATLGGAVMLVVRYDPTLCVERILAAQALLGDRLIGIAFNRVPEGARATLEGAIAPFLEAQGIPILGLLPSSALLRSVSVGELVEQLQAEVLCRPDRLDLMVEDLKIGAMNVNSALKYFRKGNNMAVVTGGDRADIQLAALETSTHCLILTGQMPPDPTIVSRAEDMEVPILSVALDTLTTVEIIDRAFGQVRLREPAKVHCIEQLMGEYFDFDRLLGQLGLEAAAV